MLNVQCYVTWLVTVPVVTRVLCLSVIISTASGISLGPGWGWGGHPYPQSGYQV